MDGSDVWGGWKGFQPFGEFQAKLQPDPQKGEEDGIQVEALVNLLVNGFIPRLIIHRVQNDDTVTMEVFDGERQLFRVGVIDAAEDRRLIFEAAEEDDIILPLVIDLAPMVRNDLSRIYVERVRNWLTLFVFFEAGETYWDLEREFRAATWRKLADSL